MRRRKKFWGVKRGVTKEGVFGEEEKERGEIFFG